MTTELERRANAGTPSRWSSNGGASLGSRPAGKPPESSLGLEFPSHERGTPAVRAARAARGAVDGFVDLLSAQVRLAKLEIARDLAVATRGVARALVGAVLGLAGYALLLVAVATLLAPSLGWSWTLLLLGLPHAAASIWVSRVALAILGQARFLDRSSREVSQSLDEVGDAIAGDSADNRPRGLRG